MKVVTHSKSISPLHCTGGVACGLLQCMVVAVAAERVVTVGGEEEIDEARPAR